MFSKVLIKLIDQAIIPAIVLLATRIVSLVLVSNQYGYSYSVGATGFTVNSPEEVANLNSYSTLFMAIVLALGLTYILIKALVFRDSHISPSTTAKLYSLKFDYLIQNSYKLYTQGSVWLSYLYLLTVFSGYMALNQIAYIWVFYITFLLSLILTVLFVMDVEHEMAINKREFEEAGYDSEN